MAFVTVMCMTILAGCICKPVQDKEAALDQISSVNKNFKNSGDLMDVEDIDVKYTPEQRKHLVKLAKKSNHRSIRGLSIIPIWPDGIVHYTIAKSFDVREKYMIESAMLEIELKTCLKFQQYEVSDAPEAHVEIFKGTGCWSYVGRIGGIQQLSLQSGYGFSCLHEGAITHELLHAIGVFHEQSRPDRDNHVAIIWDNVLPGYESNFHIYEGMEISGIDYNPKSVMHYSNKDFSKNDQNTIVYLQDPSLSLGGSILTGLDVKKINMLYNCNEKTTARFSSSTKPTATSTTTSSTTTTPTTTAPTSSSTTPTTTSTTTSSTTTTPTTTTPTSSSTTPTTTSTTTSSTTTTPTTTASITPSTKSTTTSIATKSTEPPTMVEKLPPTLLTVILVPL